jgi:hypothetical protein
MPRYEFLEEILSQGSASAGYRKTEKLEPDYNVRALQFRGSFNVNITTLGAPAYVGQLHASDIMEEIILELNRNVQMRTFTKLRDARLYDRILSGGDTPQTLPAIGALAPGDNIFKWTLNMPMGFYGSQVKNPHFGWLIRRLMTLFKTTVRFGIASNIFTTEPTTWTLDDNKVEVWATEEPIIKYPGKGVKYANRVELFDDETFVSARSEYRIKLEPYNRTLKGILVVAEDTGVAGGLTDALVDSIRLELNSNRIVNETSWETIQNDNKDDYSPQGATITTGAIYYDLSPMSLADSIDLKQNSVRSCNLILNINTPATVGRTRVYLIATP